MNKREEAYSRLSAEVESICGFGLDHLADSVSVSNALTELSDLLVQGSDNEIAESLESWASQILDENDFPLFD